MVRAVICWLLIVGCFHAVAQEKQIPFFPEGNIKIIDKAYAKKSSLFTNYENFIEARLFEVSSDEYAVEIYYEKSGIVYKDRKILNEKQKTAYIANLKNEVVKETPSLAKQGKEGDVRIVDQTGRPLLLINSTIVGLGFYGYALPNTLQTKSNKAFVALYMLTGGASFLIPFTTTKDKHVNLAQTSMTFYGQTRGVLHGTLLANALTEDITYDYYTEYNDYSEKLDKRQSKIFGLGIAASVTEGIIGFTLADKWDYSPGDASVFQMWGDVGALQGLLLSNLLGFYEKSNNDNVIYTVLATSAAGMVVGKQFGDSKKYTVGDAIFYRSSIGLGAMVPPLLLYYFEPNDMYGKSYAAAALAGSIGGSYLGWKLLQDVDFTAGQGLIISFSGIAGALTGLGLGYLVSRDDTDGKFMLTTGALGGIAGYALTYKHFSQLALAPESKADLNMSFNPASLILKDMMPKSENPMLYNELFNLSLRF